MLEPQHLQPCDSPHSAHDDSLRAAARRLGQGRCIMRRAKATGQHSKARKPCGTRIIAPNGAAPAPRLSACRRSRDTTQHGRHRYCQEGCGLLRTLQESASETGSLLGPAGSLTALDNASGPPRRGLAGAGGRRGPGAEDSTERESRRDQGEPCRPFCREWSERRRSGENDGDRQQHACIMPLQRRAASYAPCSETYALAALVVQEVQFPW